MRSLYERDPGIGKVADLPLGWRAWRESPDAPWQREPLPVEEDDGDDEGEDSAS